VISCVLFSVIQEVNVTCHKVAYFPSRPTNVSGSNSSAYKRAVSTAK
jgi:hypothetical protein